MTLLASISWDKNSEGFSIRNGYLSGSSEMEYAILICLSIYHRAVRWVTIMSYGTGGGSSVQEEIRKIKRSSNQSEPRADYSNTHTK